MATITGEDKAVLLLASLPPESVERVLERLGPERGGLLRDRLSRLDPALRTPEFVDQVMTEVAARLQERRAAQSAANDPEAAARKHAEAVAAYAAAAGKSPPPESPPPEAEETQPEDPVKALAETPPERVAAVLLEEQPHVAALVLNAFTSTQAGEVLKRFTPELRREVSLRLPHLAPLPAELLERIARPLLTKTRSLAEGVADTSAEARYRRLADVLRMQDKADRMDVLAAMEQNDPATAAKIKELLYQFEDLLRIEDRSMQKLLAEIDSKNLALALKGAEDPIKEKVMNNLSKRARETLNEEMEFLGAVPQTQIQQARKMVVEVIQRLDQAGELVMLE